MTVRKNPLPAARLRAHPREAAAANCGVAVLRHKLASYAIVIFTGVVMFCGCRTVYDDAILRRHDHGRGKSPGAVISMPTKNEGALRSSHYRFACALPKPELDRVITAMEQYIVELLRALAPKSSPTA